MRTIALATLAIALTLSGCDKEYHTKSTPISSEYDKLWSTVRRVLGKRYEIDEKASNKEEGVLTTRWRLDVSHEYLRTYRRKAEIKIVVHPSDKEKAKKDQRWQVQMSILREVNQNIEEPMNVEQAEWKDSEFDDKQEMIITAEIRMELEDLGPSDALDVPEVRELDASADDKWIATPMMNVTQTEAWDSILAVGRNAEYQDKLLQPQLGRYEADWLPDDHHLMDQANQRRRLVAMIIPETKGGKTRHKIHVRVELQRRDRLDDEWRDTGRDTHYEQVYGLAIWDMMIDKVSRSAGPKDD